LIKLETNIVHRNVCRGYRNVHILYIQYICTLQARMTTSGIVAHYIVLGCQSPTTVLDGNFVCGLRDSDLRSVFQERIPGVSKMRPTCTATANDYTTDVA